MNFPIACARRAWRLAFLFCCLATARAQTDQIIYDDARQNGWQDYGWATLNYSNATPVHGRAASISVTAGANQAVFVHHAAFDSSVCSAITFWIHGGAAGGQPLRVQGLLAGVAQTGVSLAALPANAWQQITIPLANLGVANKPNLDGFWIQARLIPAGRP